MPDFFILSAAASRVAIKSDHIAQIDPNGLTLTLVCVCVVFGSLLLLYGAYSVSGGIFTGKFKKRRTSAQAAADGEEGGVDEDEAAAISVALHTYLEEETLHDNESGVITIKRNSR